MVSTSSRAMPNPSRTYMVTATHVLHCFAGTINFDIICKKEGFTLTAFLDANRGSNPNNGKPISSHFMMMSIGPVGFKVGLQGITAQSFMETEFVPAELARRVRKNVSSASPYTSTTLQLCMWPGTTHSVRVLSTWLYGCSASAKSCRKAR